MASTIVFVLVLVLGATFALSISSDGETLQLTKSLSESYITERTPVLDIETVRSLEEDILLVPSFTIIEAYPVSFKTDHVKRIKRKILTGGLCPSDKIEYHGHCLTPEEYANQAGDDYEDLTRLEKI